MITLEDAKRHLNLTTTDDDALVADKIASASAWIDLYTGTTYTSDAAVPAPVKEACRQLTAHLYQNRESSLVGITAQELPFGTLDMLASYKAFVF